MRNFLIFFVFLANGSESFEGMTLNSMLELAEINEFLVETGAISYEFQENVIFLNLPESELTGDSLGIRAGGEPPLKTGESPRNTVVASTKMRFKIPDMNA